MRSYKTLFFESIAADTQVAGSGKLPLGIEWSEVPLDLRALPMEDKRVNDMRHPFYQTLSVVGIVALFLLPLGAQDPSSSPPKPKPQTQKPESGNRLTIEVKGGANNVPVENASVYVKFVEERSLRKDKKYELNVKTNRDGVTHVPDSPLGKVLVQVIAQGWKTYGRWYEITELHQTIQIHLERPPKWY